MISFFQDFVTKHQIDYATLRKHVHTFFYPNHMRSIYYKGT